MNIDNIWLDPLYLDDLLSEEEKKIRNSAHNFCNKYQNTEHPVDFFLHLQGLYNIGKYLVLLPRSYYLFA